MMRITETIGLDWAVEAYNKEAIDRLVAEAEKEIEKRTLAEMQKFNKWCELILRTQVAPPIKGEITKNKLQWRGIKLTRIWRDDNFEETYTIIQRGKLLGEFVITYVYEANRIPI